MPPVYCVIISPEATVDLRAIHEYVSRDSPANASKLVGRLLDAIESLAILPHRNIVQYRSRRLSYPVRSFPVRPYVIYFRAIDDEKIVRILTVRHGARQRPRRFP